MLILSWNIYNGGNIEITKEILKISADILCLQEVTDTFLKSLTESYTLQGKVQTHCHFCTLLTKKNLKCNTVQTYFQSAVSCVIDDTTYVSCHLVPYYNNQQFRLEQLQNILKRITTKKIIIAGDMNMSRDQTFNDLQDVGSTTDESTWFKSFFESESVVSSRYDRIFTNVTGKYSIIDVKNLSDHLPVMFEV